MPEPDFGELERELLCCGIAPRHVRRTVSELRDHHDDLVVAGMEAGLDRENARRVAAQQLGDLRQVAIALQSCPELRAWPYRFPRLAVVVYPLTCLLLLPAVPIFAGVSHAPQLARWGACTLLAGIVTAAILLGLQLSISLG